MIQEGETFNKDNDRTIWRTIFVTRIFRVEIQQPQFWVIDAIDECSNHSSLFSLISKVSKKFPLRVLVSSRPSSSIARYLHQEKVIFTSLETNNPEAKADIRLMLEVKTQYLCIDETARRELIEEISDKSNGCFLWVALVLKELETTHSKHQIQDLFHGVPNGMEDLYMKILNKVACDMVNKVIANAILRWVVCAFRLLTIDKLSEALRLDIQETFLTLEKFVGTLCGNLVYVDAKKRVQIIHQTARAFLSREDLESELKVDKSKEHFRVSEVCLEYLASKDLHTSKFLRGGAGGRQPQPPAFASYAAVHFSDHFGNSPSAADSSSS